MHVPLITHIYSILSLVSLQLKRTYVLVATNVLLQAMHTCIHNNYIHTYCYVDSSLVV